MKNYSFCEITLGSDQHDFSLDQLLTVLAKIDDDWQFEAQHAFQDGVRLAFIVLSYQSIHGVLEARLSPVTVTSTGSMSHGSHIQLPADSPFRPGLRYHQLRLRTEPFTTPYRLATITAFRDRLDAYAARLAPALDSHMSTPTDPRRGHIGR